jgi:hypothetical protein
VIASALQGCPYKTFGKNSEKNGSEIFMLKTLKCYDSMNIAQIAFGVVRPSESTFGPIYTQNQVMVFDFSPATPLHFSSSNMKMLSSPGLLKILKFCYCDIVVMTHTHLSTV